MNTTQIAVDLAKSVFQVSVSHAPGRVDEQHRLSRRRFRNFFLHHPPARVLMEACSSAHHRGPELQSLGHQVSLLPPAHGARYRQGNKTDRADAKALLEAARNEDIIPVPLKSLDQQAINALHRVRSGYLATRTARINTVLGLLREFGHILPQRSRAFLTLAHQALDDESLPAYLRAALSQTLLEIHELQARADDLKAQLERLAPLIPSVRFLMTVPGIGILSATALVATVGDVRRFPSGRAFAAYLGLTPRESSTGASRRLGPISKRGDRYLRMLLIHGARSALLAAHRAPEPDTLQTWALRTAQARGHNIATVALANRMARIAWRVWRDQRPFQRRLAQTEDPASPSLQLGSHRDGLPVGPAWGRADNARDRSGSWNRLAPHARIPILARSTNAPTQGPKIRLQSTLSRLTPLAPGEESRYGRYLKGPTLIGAFNSQVRVPDHRQTVSDGSGRWMLAATTDWTALRFEAIPSPSVGPHGTGRIAGS